RKLMQRIPLVDIESASPDVQSAFRALPVPLNIFRMMAHAPMSFRPLMRLVQSILSAQQLEPKLREYAILQAVHSYGGRYEWIQHVPIAEACGATAEQIKAIEDGNLGASCFDEKEKAFLAFVDESAKKIRCSEETPERPRDRRDDPDDRLLPDARAADRMHRHRARRTGRNPCRRLTQAEAVEIGPSVSYLGARGLSRFRSMKPGST